MTLERVRKTRWDDTAREPIPPSMAEIVERLERLERRTRPSPAPSGTH